RFEGGVRDGGVGVRVRRDRQQNGDRIAKRRLQRCLESDGGFIRARVCDREIDVSRFTPGLAA
ncbi:MAG: hypothetical protein AAF727_07690, partial [Pseudomonadota bacterium]